MFPLHVRACRFGDRDRLSVLFHVTLLFSTARMNFVLTRWLLSCRVSRRHSFMLLIYTVHHRWVSLDFIRLRQNIPMTFTTESLPAQARASSPKASSSSFLYSRLLLLLIMLIKNNVHTYFAHPLMVQKVSAIDKTL